MKIDADYDGLSVNDYVKSKIKSGVQLLEIKKILDKNPHNIRVAELCDTVIEIFRDQTLQQLEYIRLFAQYDSYALTYIATKFSTLSLALLQKFYEDQSWLELKPKAIARLITDALLLLPESYSVLQNYLEYKEKKIIQKSLDSQFYLSLLYRKKRSKVTSEQFHTLLFLLLNHNIPIAENRDLKKAIFVAMCHFMSVDNVRLVKSILRQNQIQVGEFEEILAPKFYSSLQDDFKLEIAEIFYKNAIRIPENIFEKYSVLLKFLQYQEIRQYYKTTILKDILTGFFQVILAQVIMDYWEAENDIDLLLVNKIAPLNYTLIELVLMAPPQSAQTEHEGAYAAAHALIPAALCCRNISLFREIISSPDSYPHGIYYSLGKYYKDFTPIVMLEFFQNKEFKTSQLIEKTKTILNAPFMTLVPMIYINDKAKFDQLEPIFMLKLIRNFIQLTKNNLSDHTIAHAFVIFLNSYHWLTLNFFTKASLKKTQWLACDSINRETRVFDNLARCIEKILTDLPSLRKFIRNTLSMIYNESLSNNDFRHISSLLKTWVFIEEFKLLKFSFQNDDIQEFKKIEKVLSSAQSGSLLEQPSKKLIANFKKIKSSLFPSSDLQFKNCTTSPLNNPEMTQFFHSTT